MSFKLWQKYGVVHISIWAHMMSTWIVNLKKSENRFKKFWIFLVANIDEYFEWLQSFIKEWHSWKSWRKNRIDAPKQKHFGMLILFFFCHGFHKCHSLMKLCNHSKHLSMFATKKFKNFLNMFSIFLDFTIHADIIWAQIETWTF